MRRLVGEEGPPSAERTPRAGGHIPEGAGQHAQSPEGPGPRGLLQLPARSPLLQQQGGEPLLLHFSFLIRDRLAKLSVDRETGQATIAACSSAERREIKWKESVQHVVSTTGSSTASWCKPWASASRCR